MHRLFVFAPPPCLGPIWSMDLRRDETGIATAASDKIVKWWDFEFLASSNKTDGESDEKKTGKMNLSLVQSRALRVTDDVLSLKHSPDAKFIVIGNATKPRWKRDVSNCLNEIFVFAPC